MLTSLYSYLKLAIVVVFRSSKHVKADQTALSLQKSVTEGVTEDSGGRIFRNSRSYFEEDFEKCTSI